VEELRAWRAAQPPVPAGRALAETTVTTFGDDYAVVTTLFTYPSGNALGRQSQTWVRFDVGWRVVSAHVSELPEVRLPFMAVVKINAIEVPEGAGPELEKRFAARHGAVEGEPGFLGFELLRPVKGENRYFVYTKWESEEAFQTWANGSAKEAHSGERAKPVASGSSLLEFEVIQSADPRP
jgi:heme-degrading monooxygenase HmoA